MQQDCMKTLLDKLDEMKHEQPESVHVLYATANGLQSLGQIANISETMK